MRRVILFLILAVLLAGCAKTPKIKVSILYPNAEGKHFDVDYYRDSHMVLVKKLLKPFGLLETGIEKGLAGGDPKQPVPFLCIGSMTYNSLEEFQKAFEAHGQELVDDVPNFTNIQPVIQISEIVKR